MRNLMICKNSSSALKRIYESADVNSANKPYILMGTFAKLDEINRNQRIYTKEEYLKHLQYLREDIKKGEPLLGELDHPDDRFEVKLKEASHRVIDLWYDPQQNAIMGKIELLNTPNGKLAQSLVDQGIPLHISSRAAGSVNKDNTVSIQQIYTYDLVAKPGFADAVLHRVNESTEAPSYTPEATSFLQSSIKQESLNSALQYGFLNEDVSITEISAPAVLRKEAKELQINKQSSINEKDMSKQILESSADDTIGKPLSVSGDGAAAAGVPTADTAIPTAATPAANEESSDDEDNKKDDVSDTPEEDSNDSKKSDDKEDEPEDNGVKIIDVRPEFEDEDKDEDVEIKDVKSADDKDKDEENEDSSDDEDKEDKKEDEEESNESKDETSEECDTTVEGDGCTKDDKIEKKATEANKLNDAAKEDVEKRKKSFDKKFDDLIDAIKEKSKSKSESTCESIILAQYPVSCYLTEKNFAEFSSLSESQKDKVVAYLQDNNKFTPQQINESWKDGINYVPSEPIWLKAAPTDYRQMYESADQKIKDAINATAEYVIFESQYDINTFWENSGLKNRQERKMLNESFVNNMPKVTLPAQKPELPYSTSF